VSQPFLLINRDVLMDSPDHRVLLDVHDGWNKVYEVHPGFIRNIIQSIAQDHIAWDINLDEWKGWEMGSDHTWIMNFDARIVWVDGEKEYEAEIGEHSGTLSAPDDEVTAMGTELYRFYTDLSLPEAARPQGWRIQRFQIYYESNDGGFGESEHRQAKIVEVMGWSGP
jgi:hypothetical protein